MISGGVQGALPVVHFRFSGLKTFPVLTIVADRERLLTFITVLCDNPKQRAMGSYTHPALECQAKYFFEFTHGDFSCRHGLPRKALANPYAATRTQRAARGVAWLEYAQLRKGLPLSLAEACLTFEEQMSQERKCPPDQ